MTKELLQQALYALIDSLDLVAGAHAEAVELYSTYTSPQARIVGLKREVYAHESAIAALRAAIAQPVSNIAFLYEELRKATDGGSESMTHDDALAQIKYWSDMAAIAQPVQPATKLLTPSQIAGLIDDVIDTDDASLVLFARSVEAAHGITP